MTRARQKRGGRLPHSRRHLAYRIVRDWMGREIRRELVGKSTYPRPALFDGQTAQRDIKGHGRGTSRCKRAFLKAMTEVAAAAVYSLDLGLLARARHYFRGA